jgi:hypothetical protein
MRNNELLALRQRLSDEVELARAEKLASILEMAYDYPESRVTIIDDPKEPRSTIESICLLKEQLSKKETLLGVVEEIIETREYHDAAIRRTKTQFPAKH